jgi:hypothetical protein
MLFNKSEKENKRIKEKKKFLKKIKKGKLTLKEESSLEDI